jgi:hypothetical protein
VRHFWRVCGILSLASRSFVTVASAIAASV